MHAMQKALVTGANGFIGSHLVDRLVSEGVSVRCLVRKTSRMQWLTHPHVELAFGELLDQGSLQQAVTGIDTVFHLGGKTKAATREDYFQANATGTKNLLHAVMRNSRRLKRFVYVSSQAAAGPGSEERPVRETDPPHPVTPYGQSKLAGEAAVMEFSSEMPVTVIRPPSVFGPRDKDLFKFFKMIHLGIRPRLGWKQRFFSIVYIEDLVEGLMHAARSEKAIGQIFFVNTEDRLSWQDFGTTVARVFGKTSIPLVVPVTAFLGFVVLNDFVCNLTGKSTILNRSKIPEFLPRYWITDSTKARIELGVAPKHELSECIRKTVEWYTNRGWL